MPIVVNPSTADVPIIDDGMYLATVIGVQQITLEEPDQFGDTEKVLISVSFTDVDGEKWQLDPRPNLKWGDERGTLYKIAVACGLDVSTETPFDCEDLLGCKVNILVATPTPGKWPRITAWSKVAKGKAAAAAPVKAPTAPPAARQPASVITAEGKLDTNAFWAATRRMGWTQESVGAAWDGIDKMLAADPIEVAAWLLAAQQEAAEAV
jgi:hypothetical protein